MLKIFAHFLSTLKTKLELFHHDLKCPSSPDSCLPLKLICHLHTLYSCFRTCFRCYTLFFTKVNVPDVSHDLRRSLLFICYRLLLRHPYVYGWFLHILEIQLEILQRNFHDSSGWLDAFSLCPSWLIVCIPIRHHSLYHSVCLLYTCAFHIFPNCFHQQKCPTFWSPMSACLNPMNSKDPSPVFFISNLIASLNVLFSFQLPLQFL